MKKFLCVFAILAALAVNTALGASVAGVMGFSPMVGAAVSNAAGIISTMVGGLTPSGSLGAGVFTEVWTGEMNKAFKLTEEAIGWYKRIRSYDQYVENDVIHFVNIGGKPEVLINNNTYPIGISTLDDADKPIGLDKYQTKRTVVSDDELHACSYDKMGSTIERHKESIEERKYAKAIHAIAPDKAAKGATVVATTGAASVIDPVRKAITLADILKIKKAFDELKVPMSERILVLCPDHANDLLALDQKFADQYASHESGKIGRKFGFEIYEYVDNPLYNATNGQKLAFGAVATADHTVASVAFAASKVMRADGTLKMYHKEAKNNPDTQANEVNFRKYSICLPLGTDCIAAIYSAKA